MKNQSVLSDEQLKAINDQIASSSTVGSNSVGNITGPFISSFNSTGFMGITDAVQVNNSALDCALGIGVAHGPETEEAEEGQAEKRNRQNDIRHELKIGDNQPLSLEKLIESRQNYLR